jgi:hypothetical protein
MILYIKNEDGEIIQYECDEFDGYDVFQTANDVWGLDGWLNYTVTENNAVIERVLNPQYLQPHRIQ